MKRRPKVGKTSRYKRFQDGRWIRSRYLLFRWWFKFLRYAELDPSRTVDWSRYHGWGGATIIRSQLFEVWWKERWQNLFGTFDENVPARYEVDHRKARAETIRIALLVYEHRHLGEPRKIFTALNKRYRNLGSLDEFETDEQGKPRTDASGKPIQRIIESKYLTQYVKRYLRQAERILDAVCEGRFG